VVLAGVVMNFVLAVVIISYLFAGPGVALPSKNIKIVEVTSSSPAASVGLAKGDEVLSVNGERITSTEKFIGLTRANEGKPLSLVIERNGEEKNFTVTPRTEFPKGQGPLGVAISNVDILKYPWYQAPFFGTIEAFKFSWMILAGLGDMVTSVATKHEAPQGVAGPIGVAQLTGQAVSYGTNATLWFVALLSLNLAVVNVLPIPALDGGRLFFILIELVTRKKVPQKYETMSHAVGLVVLLGLILLITAFDIFRLLSGQPLIPQM
jgi:regulator of sigma E protease